LHKKNELQILGENIRTKKKLKSSEMWIKSQGTAINYDS